MQQAGSHPRNKSSFLVFMLDREPGGFVFADSFWSLHAFLICLALCCQRHHHAADLIRLWRKHQ